MSGQGEDSVKSHRQWVAAAAVGLGLTLSNQARADGFLDGRAVFRANDGLHGYQPYVTDGTAAGTSIIRHYDQTRQWQAYYSVPGAVALVDVGSTGSGYKIRFVDSNGVLGPNVDPAKGDPGRVPLA